MTWICGLSKAVGQSHIASGLPCQDAIEARIISPSRFVVALSDGAGSAVKSQIGSQSLVESACALVGNFLETVSKLKINWKVKKSGLGDIYKQYDKLKKLHKTDYGAMTAELKKYFKELAPDNPAKDHEHYCFVDKQGIYFASDISRGGGGGPKWQIKNPTTGEVVNTPARGWAFSKEDERFSCNLDVSSLTFFIRILFSSSCFCLKFFFFHVKVNSCFFSTRMKFLFKSFSFFHSIQN
jgi:hypothetical protein